MRRLSVITIFISSACFFPTARAQTDSREEHDWRFTLDASVSYGPVSGSVQTPSGGEPGTSSPHRPKLSEIGIDDAFIYDVRAIATYHNEELYGQGEFIRLSGSSTLDESLVSQGRTFPAGADVNGDVQLDWYSVGYRHRFVFGDTRDWTLWPSVGAAIWNFHYTLDSPGLDSADRAYIKANAIFGIELEWRPHRGPFSVDLELLGTPPISSLPWIYSESLVAKYRLLGRDSFSAAITGGIKFEQIQYEDSQSLPNRVDVEFGPMAVVGFDVKF